MAPTRPAAFFIGDHLALDFLNSVAAPWGEEIEWLSSGEDLLAWLDEARALPRGVSADFREHAGARSLDAVASQARELRDWLRAFVERHAGKRLSTAALRELGPVNELLELDDAYRQIESAPVHGPADHSAERHQALRCQTHRRWGSAKMLLLPFAEAIAQLVCEEDFALVRKCEGPGCTLWFLDVRKTHARRWCSMAVCGNRAKAAAYRARARGHVRG